jgi:hypothetical protein
VNEPIHAALKGLLLCVLLTPLPAGAQSTTPSANGPRPGAKTPAPPPIAPEVVSRTADGGVTLRAVRISEPIKLDGRLDEEV